MALVLPHSIFLHTPKCGGWWVRNALKNAGIKTCEYGHEHTHFGSGLLKYRDAAWYRSEKTIFTFLRHPVSWYKSLWTFRLRHGWSMTHPLDFNCANNNFNVFVARALEWYPTGWVSHTFTDYTTVPSGVRLLVGRQEELTTHLPLILDQAGEEYDKEALLATPRANESDMDGRSSAEWAVYDPGVAARVCAVERQAVNRWLCTWLGGQSQNPEVPADLTCSLFQAS